MEPTFRVIIGGVLIGFAMSDMVMYSRREDDMDFVETLGLIGRIVLGIYMIAKGTGGFE